MEISYLKEFITLVELGYYADAADQLFISPSSLTRHIQAMEKEFGKTLFLRTARKVELTDFGEAYYDCAKKIVYLQENFVKEYLIRERRSAKVVVGYLGGLAQYEISNWISSFRQEHPKIELECIHVSTEHQFELLNENKCDFLLTEKKFIPKDKLDYIVCGADEYALVVPASQGMSQKEKITVSELPKEKLAIVRALADENSEFMQRLKKEKIYPDFEIIDTSQAIDSVILGNKAVIMSERPARLWGESACVVGITPPLISEIALVYRQGGNFSEKEKAFLDFFSSRVKKKKKDDNTDE